ncbi:NmrA family NAD(P)-binding protein [Oceanomicrobium pacificus]|uniref:NmrA family NAD(P)-binding protein n=1 Tax=Oceanomicrobium pacificus TaxID=2692916 RepID=A0A6B0TS59_9RHOB|nr:NmrA family NAD(P)-binding protein [Oceanomicrobium pacificus]MXU63853.1 NmrA family NAD(P)-binding protein [Oceanomicrobium pacificus]
MPAPEVLITGAGGNMGQALLDVMARAGVLARQALRSPARARDDVPGDAVAFDFTDPATWDAALAGIRSVFLLRPPAIADMDATLLPFCDRAYAAGVAQIVFLSVDGADRKSWVPHHKVEQALGGKPATILRPGFFAQNFGDAYRDDILRDDRIYVPAGQGRVTFVDLRDVAEVALAALTDPVAHVGRAYVLTGAEAVGFDHAAATLSALLGRPVDYVPASIPGYALHLRRDGKPAMAILVQTVLHVGLRFGQAATPDPTLGRLLGRAPRSLDTYLADHLDLWRR